VSDVSSNILGDPPPPAAERRTPYARAIAAQARLELVLLLRSGESLLVTIGVPLGILVFFSLVDDVLPTGDLGAVEFLVPGVLGVSVMATGLVALAISTAFERKYGVLKLLGGSPLPPWGLLAGKALAVAAVLAVQAVLIFAVAIVGLGWQPQGSAVIVLAGLVTGTVAFAAIGLLMAGTLRAEATLALVNTLFLVLLVVSGLVFDAGELPAALAAAGSVLPSGALGEVLRAGLDAAGPVPVTALAILGAWAAGASALAARLFRFS
jgi:ABC-2 type transport system permease protein